MQNVNLNLIPGSVLPVVNVSQYDVGRHFTLTVYEGATAYSLTGKGVQIRGTKPDGNGFAYDSTDGAISVSNNVVTVSTLQQMTACGGQVMCELRITSGSDVLGTINFILDCEPSALSDDTPISDTDIPAIERDFQAALDEAEADALIAEGYSKGTQDGVPATSGEPYYQDNAKYYKEQAEAAASGTGGDALKAEGYAVGTQNGTPVSSGSPYYHNNASYYAGEASTSATNAGNSETAAAGSASSASTNGLKSEGFAVGEQNGTPVASGSPYYQNNAAYYAAQAAQYATGGLIYKGSIAFASLPTTGLTNGDMYNITDDFTTDNRFVEGAGITVKAGSNIAYIAGGVNKWDILATGGGVSDMSDLQDVSLSSLADGDLLQYDSTAAKWENSQAIPNALGAVRDAGAVNLAGPVSLVTSTESGITFTRNSDGSITASGGIASAQVTIDYVDRNTYNLPAGDYILTGCPVNDGSKYQIIMNVDGTWAKSGQREYGQNCYFTANSYVKGIAIRVFSGTDLTTPVTFKPQIVPVKMGVVPYQPWAMTNRELTEETEKDWTLGTYVDISSNTSYSNAYVCPSDGYVMVQVPKQASGSCYVTFGNALFSEPVFADADVFIKRVWFLKKGLKVWLDIVGATPTHARFIPIK